MTEGENLVLNSIANDYVEVKDKTKNIGAKVAHWFFLKTSNASNL